MTSRLFCFSITIWILAAGCSSKERVLQQCSETLSPVRETLRGLAEQIRADPEKAIAMPTSQLDPKPVWDRFSTAGSDTRVNTEFVSFSDVTQAVNEKRTPYERIAGLYEHDSLSMLLACGDAQFLSIADNRSSCEGKADVARKDCEALSKSLRYVVLVRAVNLKEATLNQHDGKVESYRGGTLTLDGFLADLTSRKIIGVRIIGTNGDVVRMLVNKKGDTPSTLSGDVSLAVDLHSNSMKALTQALKDKTGGEFSY